MTGSATLDRQTERSILQWAADRQAPAAVSFCVDERWTNLQGRFWRYDPNQHMVQIMFPPAADGSALDEIGPGSSLGVSFRRGHKKCILVGQVVLRQMETDSGGQPADTLVVRISDETRELQRRVYQRVALPPDRFVAVKLWEGGLPQPGRASWPLCAGRLGNISAGGLLVEIRADQNPRLKVGDLVGVEITAVQGGQPLALEAQYRHCCLKGVDRLGLGLQFVGLEHDLPGRSSLTRVADFVRALQRTSASSRRSRADSSPD